MDLFNLAWDISQSQDIRQAGSRAEEGVAKAQSAVREVLVLEQRVDRLALVCQALWSLLQERTGLTEEDLRRRVTEWDAKDGRIDGRVALPPVKCAKCGSGVCRKFGRCLFCGEPYTGDSAFGTV